MWSSAEPCAQRESACANTGTPKNAAEKKRSLVTVPRRNGRPIVYDVKSPPRVREYIPDHAQTAKLLSRKNEAEQASAAPTTRTGPDFSRRFDPSHRMAAYHAHTTSWSQENGNAYTYLVRMTSVMASSTTGIHIWRREPRAPKNKSEAPIGVKCQACGRTLSEPAKGRKRTAIARSTNR